MVQQDVNFVVGGAYYDAVGGCTERPRRGLSDSVQDESYWLVLPPLRADMMSGGL